MNRRELISLIGGVGAAWPLASRAQEPGLVRRIGVLLGPAHSDPLGEPRITAFQRELQNQGWMQGSNILVEYRFAGGDSADRIRTLAAELLATRPDVIVAHGSACALALARETRTIPIIFVLVSDPVGSGLAASLAEPGGNATGFSNFAPPMSTKWVEFLKAFSPQLARVVLLVNPESPGGSQFLRPVEAAARSFAMESVLAR